MPEGVQDSLELPHYMCASAGVPTYECSWSLLQSAARSKGSKKVKMALDMTCFRIATSYGELRNLTLSQNLDFLSFFIMRTPASRERLGSMTTVWSQ